MGNVLNLQPHSATSPAKPSNCRYINTKLALHISISGNVPLWLAWWFFVVKPQPCANVGVSSENTSSMKIFTGITCTGIHDKDTRHCSRPRPIRLGQS
jgi:hypothetical protein